MNSSLAKAMPPLFIRLQRRLVCWQDAIDSPMSQVAQSLLRLMHDKGYVLRPQNIGGRKPCLCFGL